MNEDHFASCPFPCERCRCASIQADITARAEDLHIEEALDSMRGLS